MKAIQQRLEALQKKQALAQQQAKEIGSRAGQSQELVTQKGVAAQVDLFPDTKEEVRPELNLAKFADFIFTSPYSKRVREIREKHWETTIDDDPNIPASLKIEPVKDGKTPTTTTYKYFLALIQLWEQRGKPADGVITFSARELAAVLGRKWAGHVGQQIADEIDVLNGARLTWRWAFLGSDKNKTRLVDKMHILSNAAYIDKDLRLKKEKFTPLHSVTFHPLIVQNLLAGITKPINFRALLSIKHESAAALYTHLDIVLSKKPHWQCTTTKLIDILELGGERYNKTFVRKAKLQEWIKELDGKELSHGRLVLSMERTADGSDWKLIARKVPRIIKNRFPKKPANPAAVQSELVELIGSAVGHLDTRERLYKLLAASYSATLIRRAVSEYKVDVSNPRNPVSVFVTIVHRLAHEQGKEWIKDCGKDCKWRPNNRLV